MTEYVEIEVEKLKNEKIYRNYLTKALEIIANNTSGGERYTIAQSYTDIIESKAPQESGENSKQNVEEIKKRQHEAFERLRRRWTE